MLRFVGNLLTGSSARGRVTILIYHRVRDSLDPIFPEEIDAVAFTGQMEMLASEFKVLPLGEACRHLALGSVPPRTVCVTFDDGYADNERIALPILQKFKIPATFFIASGYSDGGIMFNDVLIEAVSQAPDGVYDLSRLGLGVLAIHSCATRRAAINELLDQLKYLEPSRRKEAVEGIAEMLGVAVPHDLMMGAEQIQHLHTAGMEIGGHTTNHPILAAVNDDQARVEIEENRRHLEEITGAPIRLFAYPNGKPGRDYGTQHVEMVKLAGYSAAVSTSPGIANHRSDRFQLPRFSPWERNPARLAARILLACARDMTKAMR